MSGWQNVVLGRSTHKPNFFRLTGWLEQNYGCFSVKPKNNVTRYLWLKMSQYEYFSAKESPNQNVIIVKRWKIPSLMSCYVRFSVAAFF